MKSNVIFDQSRRISNENVDGGTVFSRGLPTSNRNRNMFLTSEIYKITIQ